LSHRSRREAAHRLPDPFEDVVGHRAVLVEEGFPLGGDVIDLLALGFDRAHVALVFEELEGGVHGAGGGHVPSAVSPLRRLHRPVAMGGLLLQEPKDHVLPPPGPEDLLAATEAPPPGRRVGAVAEPRPGTRTEAPGKVSKPFMSHRFPRQYQDITYD